MHLVDARRLTGPNLLALTPLVIVEVALEPTETAAETLAAYTRELRRMCAALGLPCEMEPFTRPHRGGAVFVHDAPIDEMLAHVEASEWAVLSAVEVLGGRPGLSLEPHRTEIEGMLRESRSPRLLELALEARRRDLPLLWDDDVVSVGAGRRSVSFPRAEIPAATEIAWESLGHIPTALVTGTNGKTTSSRLLARVVSEGGARVGVSSTEGVTVGAEVLEQGDWTGPAAARVVLRRRDVDVAVLETARGGILRRGLAVDACDVALITNVSDDHLGLYGIDDLAAMVEVKAVVTTVVRPEATAVLNAHDARLVGLGRTLACNVTFFADLDGCEGIEDGSAPAAVQVVDAWRAAGKRVVVARGGMIVCAGGSGEEEIARVDELPITFGGVARYNVHNVLGAVAAADALGVPRAAIASGLRGFRMEDNPGRGQVVERDGVTVFLDFGHNPEGVRAAMQLVRALHGKRSEGKGRLTVVTGSPGDRTDEEISAVAQMLWDARPDRVFVRELTDYLRGRAPGDVPELFRRSLLDAGMPEASFAIVASEVEALERVFADAAPGDFVAVLVHLDQADVAAFLANHDRTRK